VAKLWRFLRRKEQQRREKAVGWFYSMANNETDTKEIASTTAYCVRGIECMNEKVVVYPFGRGLPFIISSMAFFSPPAHWRQCYYHILSRNHFLLLQLCAVHGAKCFTVELGKGQHRFWRERVIQFAALEDSLSLLLEKVCAGAIPASDVWKCVIFTGVG